MDAFIDALLALMADGDHPLGFAIIAAAAMTEYVFPPFPGDTVTIFGAVLITAYGWSFWGVFGAVMAGSLVGSMVAFWFGTWLQTRRARHRARQPPGEREAERAVLDDLIARFRRYGAAYLVVNRFLPGIRSLLFVAAGMARMRPRAVLFYSAVSAAAWNLGLVALGSLLGLEFDTLLEWLRRYTTAVWLGVVTVVALLVARAILRRRRQRRDQG